MEKFNVYAQGKGQQQYDRREFIVMGLQQSSSQKALVEAQDNYAAMTNGDVDSLTWTVEPA